MPAEPMPSGAPDLALLIDRFRKLRVADRKAVWAHLSPGEREALDKACLHDDNATEGAGARDPNRRLQGYSPWLARAVAAALADKDGEPGPTPAGRAALFAAHESTVEDGPDDTVLARLLRQLGVLGAGADDARRGRAP